jgi:hypothetical protein
MVWTAPRTWAVGDVTTAVLLNLHIRDNQLALDQHGHDGTAGDGGTSLGDLVKAILADASAPAAPGAGLTVVYSVSSRPHFRDGAAGADTTLADKDENHASNHDPGGSDTMAVDAVAGTGSLRTLGSGAQQAATGNHTH